MIYITMVIYNAPILTLVTYLLPVLQLEMIYCGVNKWFIYLRSLNPVHNTTIDESVMNLFRVVSVLHLICNACLASYLK